MGTPNCEGEPLHVLQDALKAGITMFQLREKGDGALTGEQLLQFARDCQKVCQTYKVPFIVNDDVELAIQIDADGVHVGQDDCALGTIRERLAGKMIIGVSVHTKRELEMAVTGGADYVGIGPIFATTSKTDAKAPSGVTFLQQARTAYPELAIVAIGGITEQNAAQVYEAGADGVSIITSICQSQNRQKTVALLKESKLFYPHK